MAARSSLFHFHPERTAEKKTGIKKAELYFRQQRDGYLEKKVIQRKENSPERKWYKPIK